VTAYSSIGEAFRSDRFACFQPQPDPGGIWLVQYGAQNYLNLRPAADAGDCDGIATAVGAGGAEAAADSGSSDDGISTGVLIGLGVAAALVVVLGTVLWMRRRTTADDRE
jgi:peptide/nickel transport system substrate-binding protein